MTKLQEKEQRNLARYAVKSADSAGRRFKEVTGDERLCFQRDKDRIIHCKAFRRLEQKTQVFMAGSGDHYRTRLTHTLEVAQISRDIARRLDLNEDLCEAISLAHDLGHPPFGHAGEYAINEVMGAFGMNFEHNEQSRRIVEVLEKAYPDFDGLNLSLEVLDGMVKHQTAWDQAGKSFEISSHLEAQVVNIADEIAYTNHDMDDGLRSGLITLQQLRKFDIWKKAEDDVKAKYGEKLDKQVLISRVVSTIIAMMIDDLCKQTMKNIIKNKIKRVEDVKIFHGSIAEFSESMNAMITDIRKFLYEHFYLNPAIESFTLKGMRMIKKLFNYYLNNPDKFPKTEFMKKGDDLAVAIKDYIAGMTDSFLIKEFNKI